MALALPISIKSGALVVGIVATAAGLNLSVMGIGSSTTQEQAVVSTPPPAEQEVLQVVVDVPVPDRPVVPDELGMVASEPAAVVAAPARPVATAPPATAAPTTAPPATAAPAAAALPVTAPPAPTTAVPATPPPTTSPPATASPTTVAPTTEYLSYTFDGIAEIVVAYHDGEVLEFWSATTEDGWAFMVEKNSADKIEVKFRRVSGGEGEAKFELIREDGELEVKKER